MPRLLCAKTEKGTGQILRLLNPSERPFGQPVRVRRSRKAKASSPILDEPARSSQLLVARIAALGSAIAIGFLPSELFFNS
jgi:hypothetical protein